MKTKNYPKRISTQVLKKVITDSFSFDTNGKAILPTSKTVIAQLKKQFKYNVTARALSNMKNKIDSILATHSFEFDPAVGVKKLVPGSLKYEYYVSTEDIKKMQKEIDKIYSGKQAIELPSTESTEFIQMPKLYTEAELISFGNYMLSQERKNNIIRHNAVTLEERLINVYAADISNFNDKQKNKSTENGHEQE